MGEPHERCTLFWRFTLRHALRRDFDLVEKHLGRGVAMTLQDDFLKLSKKDRELAYKVAREKLGPSKSIHVDELMAAHRQLKGVA